jgi:hypothetical protein
MAYTMLPLGPAAAQDALPADVRFDILKLELSEAVRQDRHKEVLVITTEMRKIGQALPEETSYFEARAFNALGATAMARRSLVNYLKQVGRKGRNYDQAIRLFVQIKAAQNEKTRKAKIAADLRTDFKAAYAVLQAAEARAIQWKKHAVIFGGPGADSATAITHTPNGGIVVAGAFHLRKTSDGKPLNATLPWMTAFDAEGRRVWHRPLGSATDPGLIRSIVTIPKRGFLLGGAQKNFQIAAVSDLGGNLTKTGEGDPWVIGFAPSPAGEGGIARLLASGEIMVFGAEAIGQNKKTGQAQARLPVAVRLTLKGKLLGKSVLGQNSGKLWFDVKDALVLEGGDVILAGATRQHADSPLGTTEGYLMRLSPMGKEIWLKRFTAYQGGGLAVTAMAPAADGGILAVGRDGNALVYFKLSGMGEMLWRKHRQPGTAPKSHDRLCAAEDLNTQLGAAFATAPEQQKTLITPEKIDALRQFTCRRGTAFTAATAIIANPANGFMILGLAGRKDDPRIQITLTSIDERGGIIWEAKHGDASGLLPTGILATADEGFIVVGIAHHWSRDALLFKTDKQGELAGFIALAPPPAPPTAKPARRPMPDEAKQSVPPAPSLKTGPVDKEVKIDSAKTQDKTAPAPESTPTDEAITPPQEKTEKPSKTVQSSPKVPKTPKSPAPTDEAEYDLIKILDGFFGGDDNTTAQPN